MLLLKKFIDQQPSLAEPVSIHANIKVEDAQLIATYQVKDKLNQIIWPETLNKPERRNALWKTTCMELFLAIAEQPGYWEFNFSPNGHWNAYHFHDYRQRMQTELQIKHIPIVFNRQQNNETIITATIDISKLPIPRKQTSCIASLTTVLMLIDGNFEYHALSHANTKPDFHNRNSFTLKLHL